MGVCARAAIEILRETLAVILPADGTLAPGERPGDWTVRSDDG
jgi:hypothetical protein